MSTPSLSVVIASVNGFPYLGACLDALTGRCPDAEVVVADCTDPQTRARIREGWPHVRVMSFDEPTSIPVLRAAGIRLASAPYIAVIEDHCVVIPGWSDALLAAHRSGRSVVGGPIRNTATRLRDWAAFLFEYSGVEEPMPAGVVTHLPGMNISYDRRAIAAMQDLLDAGKWEGWLHDRLHAKGFELYLEPRATIEHIKDFGVMEFVGQRFHYARAHADMCNPELGWKRIVYAGGSPLLVPLLYWRIARSILHRRHHVRELVLSTPLLVLYLIATAVGEGCGYIFGGGRSLLRIR
ncbi:MAG TPA: glycosyltransferase family 2 protein [Vicinamibacterales bacterium]|nr:glycosyltransferase family 2 protein [Vicinamibacterales bacterium]